MNHTEKMVKRLNFENFIWVCFIVVSVLDIYGDELIKKNLLYHDQQAGNKANRLFLELTVFSLFVYIYFMIRNYHDYQEHHNKTYEVRLMGSVFILIGTICLLYFQISNRTPTDSLSNI